MKDDIRYLNTSQTSEYTGIAVQTLFNHRSRGKGIPYIKAGRSVKYDIRDIEEYMQKNKVVPES